MGLAQGFRLVGRLERVLRPQHLVRPRRLRLLQLRGHQLELVLGIVHHLILHLRLVMLPELNLGEAIGQLV